jgi:hypothetical protein
MAIRVRADGTTTNVENVSAKGITIVKKVTVGKPVRKVNAAVANINNLAGVDTTNKEDGFILVYNETTEKFEAKENTAENVTITNIGGIDAASRVTGSVLVYNAVTENFETTTDLEEQTINGGQY